MNRRAMRAEIPAAKRRIAKETAAAAARELGLPIPAIVWRKASDDFSGGWVEWDWTRYVNEIHVTADVPADELAGVIAHEARHLWQRRNVRYVGEMRKAEQDADAFAFRLTGVLLTPEFSRRIR